MEPSLAPPSTSRCPRDKAGWEHQPTEGLAATPGHGARGRPLGREKQAWIGGVADTVQIIFSKLF